MTPTTSIATPYPEASRGPAGEGTDQPWTPGPWTVEDPLGPEILSIVAGGPEVYDWLHVAQLSVDAEPDEMSDELVIPEAQVKANACLIAAAPDLYAALDEILDYRGGADSALHDPHVVDRARQALARATPSPGPAGAFGAAAGGGA